MSDVPYSFFKRNDVYYVRFKNSVTGKYGTAISTHKKKKVEAIQFANDCLTNGIPTKTKKKNEPRNDSKISITAKDLIGLAKSTDLTQFEVKKLIEALTQKGDIKSAVITGSKQDVKLIDYLLDFWTWESSSYIREKINKGQSIHKTYVDRNYRLVLKYWEPFFKDILLGELTRQQLKDFLNSLATLNLSNSTRNQIFKIGQLPLKQALYNELISTDLSSGFSFYANDSKQREILTWELFRSIMQPDCIWKHPESKLAFFITSLTGMRQGEIRGLRLQDLGENCIYVNHSFSNTENLKSTKNGEARIAQFPFPEFIQILKQRAYCNPHNDGFVFWGLRPNKPMDCKIWLDDLHEALQQIGLTKEDSLKYCFHSGRHFFTTMQKDLGIENRFLQMQTGHKTERMLEHYANHETQEAINIITANQIEMKNRLNTEKVFTAADQNGVEAGRMLNQDLLKTLPKPKAENCIEALKEAGLIDSSNTMTNTNGFSFCVLFLLHHGYELNPKDFHNLGLKSIDNKIYSNDVITATIRKQKNKIMTL